MKPIRGRELVVAVAALLSLVLGATAYAKWSATSASGATGHAGATTLDPGALPGAAYLGTSIVQVSWAPTVLPDGTDAQGYDVRAYDASSGTGRAVSGGCASLVLATTCLDTPAPDGVWRYAVVPRQQAWAGPESARSAPVVVDTLGPSVAINFPATSTYDTTQWSSGCTNAICGTATDALSVIGSVTVSVRRASTGLYWNGVAFAASVEALHAAGGTTNWSLPFPATNFTADGPYVVRAVATDALLNQSSASTTFTYDAQAPSVLVTFPTDGSTSTSTAWNAGCGSAICGTAADAGGGISSVVASIRRASTGLYWNGTSFGSAGEVLLAATGTTSWSLAFPAASFPADGSYTIRAVATDTTAKTGTASVTFTHDDGAPSVTAVALVNGLSVVGVGLLNATLDDVTITYSEPLAVASVCSAWSGNGSNQSLAASNDVVVTVTDAGSNDVLSVASGTCTLHVGTIALGGNYVSSTSTFAGLLLSASTVSWNVAARTLTIHFGLLASGSVGIFAQSAGTATYTPASGITDAAGNALLTSPFAASGQRL